MTQNQYGRATQARFLLDAHLHGLEVSIPFDALPGYDVVVDTGVRLWRIQVKGATMSSKGVYSICVRRAGKKSVPNFDVCAVWLSRENRWVFLPRSIRRRTMIHLTPHGKFSHRGWEIFRKSP